ncbi:MAG: glutaredoxin 3 [Patescibacteria group bacterium]|jgi:glutaredoxin 3
MASVTIFTTPTCSYCKDAKAYFKSKNIDYTEVDASTTEGSAKMQKVTDASTVPVIQIGKEIILGFDKAKIDAALSA